MQAGIAGLRLLVVEDEALVAMLIEDELRTLGCAVVGPVATVAQALALLRRQPVDGALLDVNLGGGESSYPIADALAAQGVPFVFLTGYGGTGVDRRYAAAGILQKPFASETLRRIVESSLAAPSPSATTRRGRR